VSVLLRQAQIFERILPLLVHRDPLDCSIADCRHKGEPSLNLDSFASNHVARPRHYHVITHLDELVGLDPKGLPARGEFLPNTPNLIKSEGAAPRTECPREVRLCARSRVFEHGIQVLAVERVVCGLDDLDVLVRNTPSPALRVGVFIRRV
jgi:hypothetical protein